MPYHDPLKPFVNLFFASSNGNNINAFNKLLDEKNQDRLEEEGGACIVYTHFGFGFFNNNEINKRSAQLISRLAKKNAWFCTVSELLDFLDSKNDFLNILKRQERKKLEKKWFFEKLRQRGWRRLTGLASSMLRIARAVNEFELRTTNETAKPIVRQGTMNENDARAMMFDMLMGFAKFAKVVIQLVPGTSFARCVGVVHFLGK